MGSRSTHRFNALHAGIVLACSVLVSSSAFSLVLGDITLSSGLNEPLAASIELDSLAGVEASEITVTVGDQTAYDQAGVDRDPVLDSVQITVEIDNENEGRIVLSSAGNVVEPFLNLIVTVSEPGGDQQREYTLLLELPSESAVTQREATPPAAGANTAPVATAEPAAAPAQTAAGADTYTVGSGDTMWEIAQSTRPDSSVSVQQMMLAIQRANPESFINNDINRVIGGRVLRIPSQQEIAEIDQQSAARQIAQQSSDLGGQPLAAGNGAAGVAPADTRDQLRVLGGDEAGDAGGGSTDLAAAIAALENELMLSEESLDRARIENLELNNRMSALQEQIDLLENIIAMEDDRIATLQAELTEQAAATEQALASADTAATAIEAVNNEPAPPLPGFLRNGVVVLGGLVLVVLAVLGYLVHRRRQAQLAAEESHFNPALADTDDDLVPVDIEKPGLLAGLLARFRRDKEEELDADDDYEMEVVTERREAIENVVPQPVAQPKKDSTDHLLDEMGIQEEMSSLDDALDTIDDTHADETAEVFEPVVDEAQELEEETDQLASSEQARDSDYALTAAAAAFAAIDKDAEEAESIEFTTAVAEPAPIDVPAEAAEAAQDDVAETFEFTLKDLPEVEAVAPAPAPAEAIETFDFKLSMAMPPKAEAAPPAATEAVEVIAFPGSASAPQHEPAQDDDLSLELGDLSFDDTTLLDESEEESQYKPRTGNECDTKLDLATAYEAMGDVVEAIEILDEVIAEGSPSQIETAQRLKETWQASL